MLGRPRRELTGAVFGLLTVQRLRSLFGCANERGAHDFARTPPSG
jgi:hypothetical protein